MPTYKRSSYDLFIHKVLLPNVRTILLVLGVIALGCSSWLETNISGDCTFQSSMSVFEVSIYQNISDPYALTPSSVSFGLWKHCFYYTQNCTCTPVSLNYEIDAEQSIFAATNNQTMPNIDSTHSSYIRLIPLIMGLILSFGAFVYSFWANRCVTRPFYLWLNGAVALISAVLVAIAFGFTYQSYKTSIIKACQAASLQSVKCASMAPKLEVILLAVTLGLLVLASILFGCVRKSDSSDTIEEVYIDEKKATSRRHSSFLQAIQRNSKMKSSSQLSGASSTSREPAMYSIEPDDAMDAWRNVAILDGQQQQHELSNIPLRPPPITGRRSNELSYNSHHTSYEPRMSANTRNINITANLSSSSSSSSSTPSSPVSGNTGNSGKRQQKQSSSSHIPSSRQERAQHYHNYEISDDSNELIPPTLPFADHQSQRRRQSSQPSLNKARPSSHASGNTFGANDILMEGSPVSSTFTLEEQQHGGYYGRQPSDASFRTATPSSFRYDRTSSHDSVCFTPTFNDRSSSGISLGNQHYDPYIRATDSRRKSSSGIHYQGSSSPQGTSVPTLQTPPSSRHPLNHKVITDERIGAYFQQTQARTSTS
ncbi:uncharacterized protein BX664DRAFT_322357 [Halteromyces radiatus]|uniref:uncharacterized protein n=1 Tax=Halteromyces radiatus TaxID=101107 RepID=UPI0022205B06|nr:uncharacterized protein BX664DRAFT_322357 [Halteromyces radiatus]KAI8099901.1 hypothetical protein BX664DRAFT_322357 [Halteromyces radiatus]